MPIKLNIKNIVAGTIPNDSGLNKDFLKKLKFVK